MCQTFIPLLSDTGRIVNLSSVSSTLKPYSEQIRQRFRNPDMTLEDLEQLAQEYEVPRCVSHSHQIRTTTNKFNSTL
jgi:carbonyl reductase 1